MSDLTERLHQMADKIWLGRGASRDDADLVDEALRAIERLTRELAEARAQARQAVREALEEAEDMAWESLVCGEGSMKTVDRIRAIIARLDAEEPKP